MGPIRQDSKTSPTRCRVWVGSLVCLYCAGGMTVAFAMGWLTEGLFKSYAKVATLEQYFWTLYLVSASIVAVAIVSAWRMRHEAIDAWKWLLRRK